MTRVRFFTRVVTLLYVIASANTLLAQDWPHFRGPHRDGSAVMAGINKDWKTNPPRLLWRVALGDPGYAEPIVAQGKVFILDHKGGQEIVRALDFKTGEELWRTSYEDTATNAYGYSRSSAEYDEGRVYTISRLGLAHCLDSRDGKVIWKRDVVADFKGKRPRHDLAASPVVDGGRVLFTPGGPVGETASGGSLMVALDKLTGQTLWSGGDDPVSYSTPVIATVGGARQYVLFSATIVAGYATETGKVLWRAPWRESDTAMMPVVFDDHVFISSGWGNGAGLFKIANGNATPIWINKVMKTQFSTPVYAGGHLYGTTDPGELVCIDVKTGKSTWSQKGFEKGGVIAVDGSLIALDGRTGDLVQVELTSAHYRELGRLPAPLGGQSWTAPVAAHGMLLIRNQNALACLAIK